MKRSLLLGSGSSREKRIVFGDEIGWVGELVRLDIEPRHHPDVVWDLNQYPWPFEDDYFDEIHAYEILEHLGRQGDHEAFFDTFAEIWRILKPAGYLAATCPSYRSIWAWGDPSHRRVITSGTLVFLSQEEYEKQVGLTPMSDFRYYWKRDFEIVWVQENDETLRFVLQKRGGP